MSAVATVRNFSRSGLLTDPNRRESTSKIAAVVLLVVVAFLPLAFGPIASFMNSAILALAYVVMALGLNIVVGFAGLLDLGYVAFYAFGTYSVGCSSPSHFAKEGQTKGIHFLDSATVPVGIHFNFLIVVVLAISICAIAGIIIGLPTLR